MRRYLSQRDKFYLGRVERSSSSTQKNIVLNLSSRDSKDGTSDGILMKDVIGILTKLQQLEWTSGDSTASSELRQTIPAPILGHYDRLRARGKKGVAMV